MWHWPIVRNCELYFSHLQPFRAQKFKFYFEEINLLMVFMNSIWRVRIDFLLVLLSDLLSDKTARERERCKVMESLNTKKYQKIIQKVHPKIHPKIQYSPWKIMVGRLLSFLFRARRIFRCKLAVKFPGCPPQSDISTWSTRPRLRSKIYLLTSLDGHLLFSWPSLYQTSTLLPLGSTGWSCRRGWTWGGQVAECPRNWCLPIIMVQWTIGVCPNSSYLSIYTVIFHFHDYGQKA